MHLRLSWKEHMAAVQLLRTGVNTTLIQQECPLLGAAREIARPLGHEHDISSTRHIVQAAHKA